MENQEATAAGEQFAVGGSTFNMPPLAGGLRGAEPVAAFRLGLEGAKGFVERAHHIEADPHLSEAGKQAKREPLREAVWGHLVSAHGAIDDFERHVDATEATLLAVPPVPPNAPTVAIEDQEARSWWRSLERSERAKVLHQLGEDENAANKYGRLQLALLRSPIPLPDGELVAIRSLWERARRLDDSAAAATIEQGRLTTEWARRGLGHLQGITAARLTHWDRERLAEYLSSDDARAKRAHRFGISAAELAAARARAAAKARKAA